MKKSAIFVTQCDIKNKIMILMKQLQMNQTSALNIP